MGVGGWEREGQVVFRPLVHSSIYNFHEKQCLEVRHAEMQRLAKFEYDVFVLRSGTYVARMSHCGDCILTSLLAESTMVHHVRDGK